MCFIHGLDWMKSSDRLEKVAEFSSSISAHSVRILLEANGVQAMVVGDVMNETGLELVSVYIHAEQVETARVIIRDIPAASEVLIPSWVCSCGAEVDAGFHCCWSCGEETEDPSSEE
ncbi:DUF2007 domain-containing protein [Mariniblastus sp.]|nr:DUF2007 domain-containing protein [Mariniblastus sp.]